ncbi:hypothetical protein D5041_07980 [Verminephrobacter aporrectodeae subsp. tuberculatae]|uniref:hypothetical protein n=1 Tax=Verminephrobacter aporrectodeae TaxID=1110389 RepID=UPI0022370BBB|nr:hypothetical protein [Verminephrobacter aporrectodeae]MCW5223536.1 hypothetical protein [Verminephrobacter aporrectodeae subsp. tuberculatae]MCW5289001.1 hypothetical protein [Verminephrobacter aporrectodeae subsp. tuberculatae]
MSLEQQLSDAITAQNALTQAVALWKSQIEASNQALAQQAVTAMQANRVYTLGGVTRALSVAHYRGRDGSSSSKDGVWIVKTPISFTANSMVRFEVQGYDYGEAKIIDFVVASYISRGARSSDGTAGLYTNRSVLRRGNTTKNGVWLAEDPATNNACLVFGTPQAINFNVAFVVDVIFHFNTSPSTNPADWSVVNDNSAAPATGATTGFGLINLLAL